MSHTQTESAKRFCEPVVTGSGARLTCVVDLDNKTIEYLNIHGQSLGVVIRVICKSLQN